MALAPLGTPTKDEVSPNSGISQTVEDSLVLLLLALNEIGWRVDPVTNALAVSGDQATVARAATEVSVLIYSVTSRCVAQLLIVAEIMRPLAFGHRGGSF